MLTSNALKGEKRVTKAKIAILIFVSIGIVVGLTSLIRPRVVSESGPDTAFSAQRAMAHVSAIAREPHPPGSPELANVRRYIVSQLRGMGLDPQIQETAVAIPRRNSVIASDIQNIVVKIPGFDSSKSVLLDAHYDTRAMTPGASDCSSCVGTLLELARAVVAASQLKNDILSGRRGEVPLPDVLRERSC